MERRGAVKPGLCSPLVLDLLHVNVLNACEA